MLDEMFSLKGRVALVTGGNSGIGRKFALALRDAGATVAIGARRADRNAGVLAELGGNCAAFELDVSDEVSIEAVMAGIAERYGRLDILINNAGTVNRKSVMELERSEQPGELIPPMSVGMRVGSRVKRRANQVQYARRG